MRATSSSASARSLRRLANLSRPDGENTMMGTAITASAKIPSGSARSARSRWETMTREPARYAPRRPKIGYHALFMRARPGLASPCRHRSRTPMNTDILRAELERLFELDELLRLTSDVLDVDPARI